MYQRIEARMEQVDAQPAPGIGGLAAGGATLNMHTYE